MSLSDIYWAEVAGDRRDRLKRDLGNSARSDHLTTEVSVFDPSRVYALESQADLHALRAIGCSDRIVYVVPVTGGFRLSASEIGAVTRWSRFGCKSLKAQTPLVEVRY